MELKFLALGLFAFNLSVMADEIPKETADAIKNAQLKSPYLGTGNPEVTTHPATKEECLNKLKSQNVNYANSEFLNICKSPYMAPLYNSATEKSSDAKSCIDQFEFPDVPCEYPIVWVKASEAAQLCNDVGKRLCDAHEWEGACAGSLLPPDYEFDSYLNLPESERVKARRSAKNAKEDSNKVWAYGNQKQTGICGQASTKNASCNGGGYKVCGSNTYPTGFFPECKSSLSVYDQHGNAAEHMNLPVTAEQMSSTGSKTLGHTEMKGSWFIFDQFYAHPDQCRWRAPYWHGSKVLDDHSHHNYHLGFRCCKSL